MSSGLRKLLMYLWGKASCIPCSTGWQQREQTLTNGLFTLLPTKSYSKAMGESPEREVFMYL